MKRRVATPCESCSTGVPSTDASVADTAGDSGCLSMIAGSLSRIFVTPSFSRLRDVDQENIRSIGRRRDPDFIEQGVLDEVDAHHEHHADGQARQDGDRMCAGTIQVPDAVPQRPGVANGCKARQRVS